MEGEYRSAVSAAERVAKKASQAWAQEAEKQQRNK